LGWEAARDFERVYTGLFHNKDAHAADPDKVQFASKYHVPVAVPWLCPPGGDVACFYVHEKTKMGGRMVYRLRIAAVHVSKERAAAGGDVFTADHYQFADQKAMEAMPEHECIKLATTVNSTQISRVLGGTVDFKRVPGTSTYEVQTNYEACEGSKGVGDASAPPITTHISGTLAYSGWNVEAVGRRSVDQTEVFRTKVHLSRADLSEGQAEAPLVQ